MGSDISKDLISVVQLHVHHYETRCAIRLSCKKFAKHILIFDERALPIFSNTSYFDKQNDGGIKWKGRYTYSAVSTNGRAYFRLCFRETLQHFVLTYTWLPDGKLTFKPPVEQSYLRFLSRLYLSSKYEDSYI